MDRLYYFGRFNFPHVGYLYVIREALTHLKPTRGITIVFSHEQATWKKTAIPLSHRQAMFELALKSLPAALRSQVHFSSVEYSIKRKLGTAYGGYTIDTLRTLIADSDESVGIVMGADAYIGIPEVYPGFTSWKKWTEICKLATIIVLPRGRYASASAIAELSPNLLTPIILNTQPSDLELHASSSAILAGNHTYLPASVKAYALNHGLLIQ